jgi:hypothetical protein
MDFLLSIPAWIPPAVICGGCAIAALVVYILGMAQGYTRQDYRNARRNARRRRKNRNRK